MAQYTYWLIDHSSYQLAYHFAVCAWYCGLLESALWPSTADLGERKEEEEVAKGNYVSLLNKNSLFQVSYIV